MEDVRFDEIPFAVGTCATCQRDVLTYPDPDAPLELRFCVHCDEPVTDLRRATGAELPDHGYGLLETQGCGNPDCGGGQCSRR